MRAGGRRGTGPPPYGGGGSALSPSPGWTSEAGGAMAVVTMSGRELGRLEALVELEAGRTTAAQAASLIGVGERQVFRLLKAYRARGAEGLVSRRRGRPSNRRHPDGGREAALSVIRARYA